MTLQKIVFNRKTYLKCYISSLLCSRTGPSYIDLPTSAFCTSSNFKEVCKSLIHFKELESWATSRVKADGHAFEWISATWLANQGGSTSTFKSGGSTLACKSRPTYISSNVTFERSGFENCTNMLCENAVQIHAVQIYAVQYMLSKYMECKYMLYKERCKTSAYGVFFGATDRSNTKKVVPKIYHLIVNRSATIIIMRRFVIRIVISGTALIWKGGRSCLSHQTGPPPPDDFQASKYMNINIILATRANISK